MKLENYRNQIDEIDSQILGLISERKNVALQIGQYKKKNGLEIYDPKREEEVIASISNRAGVYDLSPLVIKNIYKEIIQYCRKEQE